MHLKLKTQIFATSIRSKVLNFLVELIFNLLLKLFELIKSFRLVLHQVDIPVSTQIISEGNKITIPIAGGDAHWSTYIRMYDSQ